MQKKIGDLTLREVVELKEAPCPTLTCKECREQHSAIYAICKADIEYDKNYLDLGQEVEVEDNDFN